MAWPTSIITWAPGLVTSTMLNQQVRDALKAIGDPWQSYTPAFTGITVGNGTLSANYMQAGKLIGYRGSFTFGSTSSATTTIRVGLPVTANPATSYLPFAGNVYLFDTSATARRYWSPVSSSGTEFLIADSNYVTANATAPWTWATGDQIAWQIFYESA